MRISSLKTKGVSTTEVFKFPVFNGVRNFNPSSKFSLIIILFCNFEGNLFYKPGHWNKNLNKFMFIIPDSRGIVNRVNYDSSFVNWLL